ncbi:PaaI family thioesterase [Streptomyces lydicus]|uniref:PaaI family thioesterase n=1 Tax=Streptomyces lydicus TaxID=47763 RepID=UPI00371EDE41
MQSRIRESFDRQGLMAHLGARITQIAPGRVHLTLPSRPEVTQQLGYFHAGAVLEPGRTLTVCQLEVFAHHHTQRKLIATGQQTLIQVTRPTP